MALALIPFFTDQNIPDSVGRAITAAGHELQLLRDCMPTTAKDPLIAIACARGGQVLVSQDNDFRAIAERLRISRNKYANSLHRLDLRCDAANAASRVRDMMSLIEHEWTHARILGQPMVVEIGNEFVRIRR